MKKFIILTAGLIFASNIVLGIGNEQSSGATKSEGTSFSVVATPELQSLSTEWVKAYVSQNEGMNIPTSTNPKSAIQQAGDVLTFTTTLPSNSEQSFWKMVVGRDAVVPVMKSGSPFMVTLQKEGLSLDQLAKALTTSGEYQGATLYVLGDQEVKEALASFAGGSVLAKEVATMAEMKNLLDKQPNAIGFCMLTDVVAPDHANLISGISLVPIDKNANGRVDGFESIYGSLDEFNRGVWIGKYPAALCRNIYAISESKPENANELAFLTWILNAGQSHLDKNGFIALVPSEQQAKTNLLTDSQVDVAALTSENTSKSGWIALGVIALLIAGLTWGYRRATRSRESIYKDLANVTDSFDENSVKLPRGLFYDKSHTWTFMEKNGQVRVGMDDFLQHVTGSISRVQLKEVGESVYKGEALFTIIQNGKHLTIYSPISGKITSLNDNLYDAPSAINSAPYGEGWVYLIEPTNWFREIQFMISGEKFTSWLTGEFVRLKDFLAQSAGVNLNQHAYVLMQDGGAIKDGILEEMEPEVWEDFQTKFLDASK